MQTLLVVISISLWSVFSFVENFNPFVGESVQYNWSASQGKGKAKDKDKGDDDDHYDNDDDDNGDNNNEIPLDGGLSFLAIAGVGYGIKKMRDRKVNKK